MRHKHGSQEVAEEPAPLKALREQAGALAVPPDHLDQIAATAPEHKQMTAIRVRMSLQRYSASLTFYNTSASNDPTSGCDIS